MRLIDADALIKIMTETLEALLKNPKMDNQEAHLLAAFHTVGKMIEDAPTADGVEVVRCKDCKNWDTTWQNDWAKNYHYCPLIDGTRNGDWYCADGERKC